MCGYEAAMDCAVGESSPVALIQRKLPVKPPAEALSTLLPSQTGGSSFWERVKKALIGFAGDAIPTVANLVLPGAGRLALQALNRSLPRAVQQSNAGRTIPLLD